MAGLGELGGTLCDDPEPKPFVGQDTGSPTKVPGGGVRLKLRKSSASEPAEIADGTGGAELGTECSTEFTPTGGIEPTLG